MFAAVHLPGRVNCLAAVYPALQRGASVAARDGFGRSPLHLAARNEEAQAAAAVIPALVAEGADVNVKTPLLKQVREAGSTWQCSHSGLRVPCCL